MSGLGSEKKKNDVRDADSKSTRDRFGLGQYRHGEKKSGEEESESELFMNPKNAPDGTRDRRSGEVLEGNGPKQGELIRRACLIGENRGLCFLEFRRESCAAGGARRRARDLERGRKKKRRQQ